jgi:nicotinate-nucleotide pyrophosphorylase (carboxylating)
VDLETLISLALKEDLGDGDITSLATIPELSESEAVIIARQEGIVCGLHIVEKVFHQMDSSLQVNLLKQDGEKVENGTELCRIRGNTRAILGGERVALNFLGHLSGIATKTRIITDRLAASNIQVLDTRKTLPLYRELQKYAVRTGGGRNHRFGLYDMFLIKENHIQAAGGISNAIQKSLEFRKKKKQNWKIEVETKNLEEVKEACRFPIDIIMLDNMSREEIRICSSVIRKTSIKIEVSGNITLENIKNYVDLDIDYISMGSLTHSVRNFDVSLLIK